MNPQLLNTGASNLYALFNGSNSSFRVFRIKHQYDGYVCRVTMVKHLCKKLMMAVCMTIKFNFQSNLRLVKAREVPLTIHRLCNKALLSVTVKNELDHI